MSKNTLILHESLLRAAKGMIKAWDSWLSAEKQAIEQSKKQA